MYLEAYSRRENIKFENINEFEEGGEKDDTEQVLRLFMETELGFVDASSVEIQRVHRLGKKKKNGPRPILARSLRYKDSARRSCRWEDVLKPATTKCTRIYHTKLSRGENG